MSAPTGVRAIVRVRARPPAVFEVLTDPARQSEWMVGTSTYAVAPSAVPPGVGDRMVAFTGVAGFGFLDTMTVTVHEAPHRWVVRHDGHLVRGDGIFTVTAGRDRHSSLVSWAEEPELPLGVLGRLGWPLVRPAVRWGLRRSLQQLAALVEDQQTGRRSPLG